ncbi:MAG: beta-ketoacyl synthase N-terminal-like domain-containing protein, partial [Burkholderiales bacterium]
MKSNSRGNTALDDGRFAEPIAIVGMGGVFPGAPTLADFWRVVEAGRDTCREVPAGRWLLDPQTIVNSTPGVPDAVFTTRGCFVDPFDVEPIPGIPDEIAATLDPNFQLLLFAGRSAFAQVKTQTLDRSRVGVILGNLALPTSSCSSLSDQVLTPVFEKNLFQGEINWNTGRGNPPVNALNRYVTGLPAAMLSRSLGLSGGCFTLDAACASSLYAVKLACDELVAHRAEAMLSGGLSRPDSLYTQMGFSQLRALSPSGRCSPFDRKGDGLIVGEGAGVVVLKRLADALRDGDNIHALIRGIGLSNDIEGNLLSPSSEGQLRALRTAYAHAGWSPNYVDLIECHATGTPVGDAVEFESLMQLWQGEPWREGQCVLNAVKSNIGHLLTAASSAGLIKTLLAMRHGVLPPVANFDSPSAKVKLAGSPLTILKNSRPWERRSPDTPRRAAISGFGFGGNNAHLLIEEWMGEVEAKRKNIVPRAGKSKPAAPVDPKVPEPIAIVGMAIKVGPWGDLDAFEARVLGRDEQRQPLERKHWRGLSADVLQQSRAKTGAADDKFFPGFYLDDLCVPIDRFHISPREMAEMLPQQLLMLEVAKSALDNAGNPKLEIARSGVYIGLGLDLRTTDFHFRWSIKQRAVQWARERGLDLESAEAQHWIAQVVDAAGPPLTADRTLGALGSIVASRVAREFHIGGPSHTLCGEDTSGVCALEVAVRALQQNELDVALAGAVDLNGDLRTLISSDALRPYSSDGMARPFDVDANGPIPGEGAACLVLKRLADANRDGDRIYAVIRGIGSAHGDGSDSGASGAYLAALQRAYDEAGIGAASVQLVETHGSGARSEDLAEAGALTKLFGGPEKPCSLSSAAADVGHSGAASGLVALVKASLCLYREAMPGLRACTNPIAELIEGGNLRCDPLPRAWVRDRIDGPRRAGISSMGMQGHNIHVVMEACEAPPAVIAETISKAMPKARLAPTRGAQDAKIAFVYPGSGNQFAGMGREIALYWPEVLRAQDAENERLASQMAVGQFWNGTLLASTLADHRSLICAQVSFGAMMTDLVHSFGLRPDVAIGYSLGESTALFALRAWRARDEMLERLNQSTLFAKDLAGDPALLRRVWNLSADQPVEWIAGVIDRSADAARAALGACKTAYVLIVNTPDECVIGGNRNEVENIVAKLACHWFPLQGVSTVHCELAHPVREAYRELHRFDTTPPAGVQFYSCGLAQAYVPDRESAAAAIEAQAMGTIDFPRTVLAAYEAGVRTFIEMGPGNSCSRMIGKILQGREHFARSLAANNLHPVAQVQSVVLELRERGVLVDMDKVYRRDQMPTKPKRDAHAVTKHVTLPITGVPFAAPLLPVRRPTVVEASVATNVNIQAKSLPQSSTQGTSLTANLLRSMEDAERATVDAHQAYLRFSQNLSDSLAQAVEAQVKLYQAASGQEVSIADAPMPTRAVENYPSRNNQIPRSLSRAACLEFGRGRVGDVLGPEFAEADAFPTRVRLPDEPLMLVDRIVQIDAVPLSMSHGRVVTEHDIHAGAWYLDGGKIPTCIAVEAGQADLFLSGYL